MRRGPVETLAAQVRRDLIQYPRHAMSLPLKPASECAFDQLSLGEIMLRLDPGEGRVRTAREFKVWEGGGEYNVARGLRKCFGLKTAVCTAFVDNEVGHLIEDFIMQGIVVTRRPASSSPGILIGRRFSVNWACAGCTRAAFLRP